MISQAVATRTLETALANGGDFAEIFLENRRDHSVVLRSNRIETINSGRLQGAGIRVYIGLVAVYTYTNDISEDGLLRCAKEVSQAVRDQQRSVFTIPQFTVVKPQSIHRILSCPSDVKAKQKAEVLRSANAAARSCGDEISQVICGYSDSEQNVCIVNSEGLFVTDERVYSRMSCQAIASNGVENQMAHAGPGAMSGFELFQNTIDPSVIGKEVGISAITMLKAPACPSGLMPVVIDNGFGGVIFHEACGHSLEATSVAFGHSEFTGKLGQQIASTCVTAIDDGTIANAWGSEMVDDEGTPTTNLTLIENGILKNYMIDRLNSRRMGMAPTGSARRQSYAFAPTSRMRNTYIAAGTDSNEEMIATMGDGLYAAKLGGGSVNPATGEFNFSVTEGYMVKDGKINHPVRGASLIGKGAEILMKIDRVGKDMTMAQGMCGSISGSVPTNVGQPMIRVSGMTVGGQAK